MGSSRHKGGCGNSPCNNHNRGCRCSQCVPRCPTGPTGPAGPGSGATGATGATGASGALAGSIEKWSGLLALAAGVVLDPAGIAGPVEICTYLADAVIGGLSVTDPVSGVLPVDLANLTVAPNYPSTRRGITFDELATNIRSFLGAAIALPEGVVIDVELVRNANDGTDDGEVCLSTEYGQDGLISVIIPGNDDPPALARSALGGTCYIEPDDTYDVRVCLRNTTGEITPALVGVATSIEVSATARVVTA